MLESPRTKDDLLLFDFTSLEASNYEFVCTVTGHAEGGMTGTLTQANKWLEGCQFALNALEKHCVRRHNN